MDPESLGVDGTIVNIYTISLFCLMLFFYISFPLMMQLHAESRFCLKCILLIQLSNFVVCVHSHDVLLLNTFQSTSLNWINDINLCFE